MWNLDFPDKTPEQVFSLGAVALTDHMIAKLLAQNVDQFIESTINGLLAGRIEIAPINPELKAATLEFQRGTALFTKFKPKTKWFANNQKLEQGLSQMAQNYIGKVLATASKANTDAVKFGILGVIATYEQHIGIMVDSRLPASVIRANIAKAVGAFINKYPYGVKAEDLEKHLANADDLIVKWKLLPLKENRTIFYS